MTDWIHNIISITHSDEEKVQSLLSHLKNSHDGIFSTIAPLSEGTWSREAAIEQWGTRSDITPEGFGSAVDIWHLTVYEPDDESSSSKIRFDCQTAWSPPLGVLKTLKAEGYNVSCTYRDVAMGEQGLWQDGHEECSKLPNLTPRGPYRGAELIQQACEAMRCGHPVFVLNKLVAGTVEVVAYGKSLSGKCAVLVWKNNQEKDEGGSYHVIQPDNSLILKIFYDRKADLSQIPEIPADNLLVRVDEHI